LNKCIVLLVRILNYRELAYMILVWCHAVKKKENIENKVFLTCRNKNTSQLQTVM